MLYALILTVCSGHYCIDTPVLATQYENRQACQMAASSMEKKIGTHYTCVPLVKP